MNSLASSYEQYEAAKRYRELLTRSIGDFLEMCPRGVTNHHSADQTDHWIEYYEVAAPPLDEWTRLVGRCLSNLRHALDDGFASVAASLKSDRVPLAGPIVFPICDSEEAMASALSGLGYERNGDSYLMRTLRELQPYNTEPPQALGLLRDLAERSNHQVVQILSRDVGEMGFPLEGLPTGTQAELQRHEGPVQDGTRLFCIVTSVPVPQAMVNTALPGAVVPGLQWFRDGVPDYATVDLVLDLVDCAVGNVLDHFKKLCPT